MSAQPPSRIEERFSSFSPCFPVTDMRTALAHYEQLGFEVMAYEDGSEWGWVRLGDAEIHLFVKTDHDLARTAAAADLLVEDCDAPQRRWSPTGVPGTSDPYDTLRRPRAGREPVHADAPSVRPVHLGL